MRAIAFLSLCVAAASAVPFDSQRIVGGSVTTIDQHPSLAALLYTWDFQHYYQDCAGSILNQRSILTVGQCLEGDTISRWRVRVGSTYANSGGTVYSTSSILVHMDYNSRSKDNDIAILQVSSPIIYNDVVQPCQIAGPLFNVPDDSIVQAVGWGKTAYTGLSSEQLRQVDLVTVNQGSCRRRYLPTIKAVTDNMLCAGWKDGGRGQCDGDTGGPLIFNGVVIGLSSFSNFCGIGTFPSVNTRVNRYIPWLQINA
ncbi:trypsin CFT-1-like [Anticarsia gemmatalis]|uniref:trypsin CFT-1-like n=1 Tax=Anticarsia gemmatalis TaxID=129554 RepID=UPI003F773E61